MPSIAPIPVTSSGIAYVQSLPGDASGKAGAMAGNSGHVFGVLFRGAAGAAESGAPDAANGAKPAVSAVKPADSISLPLREPASGTVVPTDEGDTGVGQDATAESANLQHSGVFDLAQERESGSGELAARALNLQKSVAKDAVPLQSGPIQISASRGHSVRAAEGQPAAVPARSEKNTSASTQNAHGTQKSPGHKKSEKDSRIWGRAESVSLLSVAGEAFTVSALTHSDGQMSVSSGKENTTTVAGDQVATENPGLQVTAQGQEIPQKAATEAVRAGANPLQVSGDGEASVPADANVKGGGAAAAAGRSDHAPLSREVNGTMHEAVAAPPVTHLEAKQPGLEAMPPTAQVAPPAAGNVAQNPAANAATGAAAASPFERMDQGASPVVLHSGAQQVDVGVHDPNLGWVEVRTQAAAGHVDATLVAVSGQSHAALTAQLPSMAQYLQQRDVRVGTLTVYQQMNQSGAGGGQGGSFSGGSQGGDSPQSQSQPHAGYEQTAPPATSPSSIRSLAAARTAVIEDAGYAPRPLSYISVRA